jgi:UDP-N-acetylglucosamine:LPS N-acetylglucosamine transferase
MRADPILVLSGSVGRGHDSVAEACAVALSTDGRPVEILDCMTMLGGRGSAIGMAVFRRLISVPSVYDAFHFSHLRTGGRLAQAMEHASDRRLVPALREKFDERPGADPLGIAVYPTGVSALAGLKRERHLDGRSLGAVAFCTDACAHRMWIHPEVDLYITTSALAAATVRRYDPSSALQIVPPPVRPAFFKVLDRSAIREDLGVETKASTVLLMGGGWGLGPIAESAMALAGAGHTVLAVAGMNSELLERLRVLSTQFPGIRPFGLTDRVHELMAAADVVVTSPGQTCHEARVANRWLVILDVVPGHGRENALHELERGGALACSPDPKAVTAAVEIMLTERPELPPWPVSSAYEWNKDFLGALAAVGLGPESR